jgi:hypothetical protein
MSGYGWLLLTLSVVARAQDPFEIQVFEYAPLPLGAYTYEAHLNYATDGPLSRQVHFSSEWTAGLTDQLRAGLVVLTAESPGIGVQYAGFRLLPHFYAPRSWRLPVNLGLVTEFSFERAAFDQNTRRLELRGIVEKHVGRLQMDGNVVFERVLHGPGTRDGWGFEPSARIGWQASRALTPSVEYYGSHQTHLLFPGADWRVSERLTWSFGVGLGLTDAASSVILKSRFEFEFGRPK